MNFVEFKNVLIDFDKVSYMKINIDWSTLHKKKFEVLVIIMICGTKHEYNDLNNININIKEIYNNYKNYLTQKSEKYKTKKGLDI